MNKFIYIALFVCALAASVHCGNYNSYSPAAPARIYNANSYSLGPGGMSSYPSPSYPAPSYPAPSYPAPPAYAAPPAYSAPAKPKYTIQTAYSQELYPGQNNYKTYNSPPVYSQVALPILPSAPVAKLYIPAEKSYSSSSYDASY